MQKKFFEDKSLLLNDYTSVLDAIKNHSSVFEIDNIIILVIILADKLDIKKTRISEVVKKIIDYMYLLKILLILKTIY